MNERIKELEKKCWDHQTNHLNSEKFAELIVRECVRLCETIDIEYEEEGELAAWCAEEIKQHFGVE